MRSAIEGAISILHKYDYNPAIMRVQVRHRHFNST